MPEVKENPNRVRKFAIIKSLYEKLSNYNQIALVTLINVSSSQVQDIRKNLAAKNAELVIGKNTIIKKAIQMRMSPLDQNLEDLEFFQQFGEPKPQLSTLYDNVKNKVGLVLSDTPIFELKPLIESNRLETVAKVGVVSPVDVTIAPTQTSLDPSQISFFHALNISTKINKGMIEILKEVKVCIKGVPVGNSEAVLMSKLNIKPFFYGMDVIGCYDDGAMLDKDMVGITPEDILAKFKTGCNNVAALSLETGIITEASVPHLLSNAFKNLAAISMETDYKIKELENMSSGPAQTTSNDAKKEEKVETKQVEVEEEEEVDEDMGDLFGGF